MKKRFLPLLCAMLLLFSLSTAAYAVEARASDYFGYTSVRAYAKSGGKILFEVDIDATHTMQEVGASEIYVYEQQDNGSWDNVYTFTMDEHAYLIETNSMSACVDATYQGTVGKNYYAAVACYAKDSNGYECLYDDTPVVTAKLIVW